ncbi:MAG: hypothetical protein KZQ98_20755 [Candidatus Thiodiazotropha sp. (ex Lucinoma borealis)]|nr:hypothetical protein [Candidatus Thiodiazotropha sp. (ex Lucinoma borealis)]
MSNTTINTTAESIFGDVIYSYTRAQAIEDGVLVDAGTMAQEAGFNWPVALTSAVWEDCVAWTDDDSRKKPFQDQLGRLWDVLYMASHAIRTSKDSGDRMMFQLYRVPRGGHSTEAVLVTLKLIVGPGDAGEPVITILLPDED